MSQKTPLVAGFSVRLGRDRGGCDAFHDSELEFTLRVSRGHGFKRAGRIVFRADDERLTPYAGSRSGGRRAGLKDFLVLQEMLRSWRLTSRMKLSMLVGMQ